MADRAFLERLTKELTNQGKLVEAGFIGYRLAVMDPNAPADQLEECKLAFFAGAQHLFASLMTVFDASEEPTEADLNKMNLIHDELQNFAEQIMLRASKKKGKA